MRTNLGQSGVEIRTKWRQSQKKVGPKWGKGRKKFYRNWTVGTKPTKLFIGQNWPKFQSDEPVWILNSASTSHILGF